MRVNYVAQLQQGLPYQKVECVVKLAVCYRASGCGHAGRIAAIAACCDVASEQRIQSNRNSAALRSI
jgi:hypothetical protein